MKIGFAFANSIAWYKKPVNFLLRWADKSKEGHFALIYEGFTERTYESIWPKSHQISLEEWMTHYSVEEVFYFEVPKHLEEEILPFLDSLLNKPYAFPQIFLLGICILFKPFNKLFGTAILNHEKALICTEYGSRFVERFMNYKLTKSHDNTGLSDMKKITLQLLVQKVQWK